MQGTSQQQETAPPIDPVLLPFVRAADETEATHLCRQLVLEHADQVVKGIISKNLRVTFARSGAAQGPDAADADGAQNIYSDVHIQLLQRLQALKADPERHPISDFRGYVAGVTYHSVNDYFRQKRPQRHSLKNKLCFLLDNQPGFARWMNEGRQWLCSYEQWLAQQKPLARHKRYQQLLDDPQPFAEAELAAADLQRMHLADLVDAIFRWVGGPVELDDLVTIVAALKGIKDQVQTDATGTDEDDERCASELPSTDPSIEITIEMGLFLQRLWTEICQLPRKHRVALLLNLREPEGMGAIDLFPLTGVATIGQIAQVLEMSVEQFAAMWNELPLPDNEIAELLGCKRQDIINSRKSARRTLGRFRALFG